MTQQLFRIGIARWVSGHTSYMERLPDPVDPDPEPLTLEERVLRIEKHLGLE